MKIQKTNCVEKSKLFFLVTGKSGIGKTTIVKTLPGKTLILSFESGLLSLQNSEIDFIDMTRDDRLLNNAQRMKKLTECMHWLEKGTEYDNIYVDSLSELSSIFLEFYKTQTDGFQLWGAVKDALMKFCRTLRDMDYVVGMTSLVKEEQDLKTGRWFKIDIPTTAATKIEQFFDEIFFMTIDNDERVLITETSTNTTAKDRSGKLEQIEKPDLGVIMEKIYG